MIERSVDAKKAKAAFYRAFNDVDVYVEDHSRETKKLIARLLTRISEEAVRVDTIFPLGPKTAVIAKCRQDQGVGGRPRVYIVDGDIDLCMQMPMQALKRLFRLPRYCIENYLIDENAALQFLANESLDLEEDEIKPLLEFAKWLDDNQQPLRRLFTAYAVCHMLGCTERTITFPVDQLLKDVPGVIDPFKVEDRISTLRNSCDEQYGGGYFDRRFIELENKHRHKSDRDFVLHFVSAKHYLLRLLRERMKSVVRVLANDGLLKIRLADHVRATDLKDALDIAYSDADARIDMDDVLAP